MAYDPNWATAALAQMEAESLSTLSKAEIPFIILVVVVAVAFFAFMITRQDGEKSLLESLWEGNVGLAMTYWVYSVMGGIIWGLGILALNPDPDGNLIKIVWLIFACYYFLVCVGVWRAANKFVGNNAWAILAKFTVIVAVLPSTIHFLKWLSAELMA